MLDHLVIQSPKRVPGSQADWDAFFPYYAGYPESFARELLRSARLQKSSLIFDPWNGSGTTTFSASRLGLSSRGLDLNPVMIVVARARLLPPSEADSLEPLARDALKGLRTNQRAIQPDDPLFWWFDPQTATLIRSLEYRIRHQLIGPLTLSDNGIKLSQISGLAATFYVALFAVCRKMAMPFRSSNPTWLRRPRVGEALVTTRRDVFFSEFMANVRAMARVLAKRALETQPEQGLSELHLGDSTLTRLNKRSVDIVLTSPPYCTRIDYSAATRIELAVMKPLVVGKIEDLSRQMVGSIRVPDHDVAPDESWGPTCSQFLASLKVHPSKASGGYYYKTHLDYFDKLSRSLSNIASALKPDGLAILVVQESYYKEIQNDLPAITTEIANSVGLHLQRRQDFKFTRSMAGINPHSRTYKRSPGALEAVLCFNNGQKSSTEVLSPVRDELEMIV